MERVKLKVLIKFLGPVAREDLEVEVNNVNELKDIIKSNLDEKWLEIVAIGVNDEIVSSLDNVKNGDVITILPPVCGG